MIFVPVVISNGLRAADALDKLGMFTSHWPWHAYSYIQQSDRCVKSINAKITKNSPIHENADVNMTCDLGDGDIICCRSWLPACQPATSLARYS